MNEEFGWNEKVSRLFEQPGQYANKKIHMLLGLKMLGSSLRKLGRNSYVFAILAIYWILGYSGQFYLKHNHGRQNGNLRRSGY